MSKIRDIESNNTEISLLEIFYILKKYIKSSLFIIVSFIVLALFYNSFKSPIYQSTATIMIEDVSSSTDIFDMGMTLEKNYIENEIQILKSRTVAERTIKNLLSMGYKNKLYYLGKKAKKIEWLESFSNNNDIEYELSQNENLDRIHFEKIINNIRANTSISNVRNTDMLNITVKSYDPYESSLIVNTLIDVYKELDLEWATGEMSNLKTFLKEQIRRKEIDLKKSETELKQFQEDEAIFGLDDNSQLLLENLMEAESKLYNASAQSSILEQRIKFIQDQLTDDEKKLVDQVTNTINNRLVALQNQIAIKESELISSINKQGEDHAIVKQLKDKVIKLKENLKFETRSFIEKGISVTDPIKYRQSLMDSLITIKSTASILSTKESEYQKLVSQYEDKISSLPEKVLSFSRLSRNLNIDNETYSLMRQKIEEVRINEASKIGKVRIVDAANPIFESISPKKKINIIISILLGFFLSSVIIVLREFFDNTIKSIDDVERRNLSILALIPSISTKFKNKSKNKIINSGNVEKIQRRMITLDDPKSPISEAYRTLRTGLMYSSNNNNDGANVILVSSPGPGEGKTTTIVNLAMTYANLGKKTILLDCDLRKPVTHKIFSVDREPGISRYLVKNDVNISDIIRTTEVDNLSIITCGIIPPNPSEILSSPRMMELIDDLKDRFDVILIDSPPLLAVTDTFVCMKYVNQFIMVVRSGKTEKGGLDRSLDQIRLSNSPLSGVIFNDVNESNSYGKGYYYNYYQYYYADDRE